MIRKDLTTNRESSTENESQLAADDRGEDDGGGDDRARAARALEIVAKSQQRESIARQDAHLLNA